MCAPRNLIGGAGFGGQQYEKTCHNNKSNASVVATPPRLRKMIKLIGTTLLSRRLPIPLRLNFIRQLRSMRKKALSPKAAR